MSEQPEVMEELSCDDARATRKGSYSAWLKKAKSDNARFKMLQSSNTRYFTIDFEAQLLYYSSSATQKKISQPIPFREILGAERLLPPAKKKANKGSCGFLVKTRERTFELYANTPADAAHWTSGLNAARDIGKGSQPNESPPAIQEPCEPTHHASENEGCRRSDFEMLPNSVAAEDEDSDAADGNDEKDEEKQKQKTDQEPEGTAKELEEEERSRQAEAQEAIESERKAKQEAEMRLQELEVVLKAQEAEEANRKAREEAELCREQEEKRLREEKAQREARDEMDRQRQEEEALAREKEELERRQQRDEAQQAQLQLARRAQEEATSRKAEEARKNAVEKSLREEEARRQEAERQNLDLQREEVQEQQKAFSRQENDTANNDYGNELSKPHGGMDMADDCKAETETLATAFPSEVLPSELSRETEMDLLKADVRDLMFEGLDFLEEALDFVLSMQIDGDGATDEAGAESLMKLLTEEIDQKPSFYEPAKSKSKKSDKKVEKTDEEREARKARKEEKRKKREEQKAKEEPRTVEEDQRSAEGAEEAAHAIQKKGLPALQPLKPLKELPKLSARQGKATTSEAGSVPVSVRSTTIEPAPMPPACSASEASSIPISARSTAVEPAPLPPCSWEAKAAAEPSGWDSDEDKVLQTRNASSQRPKAEVPEGPVTSANAQDMEPCGWDSDEEKNLVQKSAAGSRRPSESNLKVPSQQEEKIPSGWDSEDETAVEAKLQQDHAQSEQRIQAS